MTPLDILREVTNSATKGSFDSVAIAIVYADGTSSSVYSDSMRLTTLIGAVEILKHELVVEAAGEPTVDETEENLPPLFGHG